jgi:hypothetical protein
MLRNFMTLAEACEMLSCPPSEVQKLLNEGLLSVRVEPGTNEKLLRRDEVTPLAAILAPHTNEASQPRLFKDH